LFEYMNDYLSHLRLDRFSDKKYLTSDVNCT
jgi:hypothetical protein